MKKINLFVLALVAFTLIFAAPFTTEAQQKKVPPSLRAWVAQALGTDAKVSIEYSRPGVKGRTIWGELVPYGLAPGNKYSKNQPFPWRAGANQNTTFEVNKDIMVEGKKLPAGKYGIHMIPSKTDWVIIFSKNSSLWGSYAYNKEEDALRIKVTPIAAPHQEWLTFGFDELAGTAAVVFLHWEKLRVPFKISLK